jgi:glyoxylase-like metal-dependent hydrolase (beta-lactamase superfamily II)
VYTVKVLKVGSVENAPVPEMLFMRGWGNWMDLNVYVWVIEGGETPVIVDTGIKDLELLARSTKQSMPVSELGGDFEVHRWTQDPSETTERALRSVGVDPAEVGHVILTHLHYDHSSNISLFPNAQVVVSLNGVREAVASKHPQIQGFVPRDVLCDVITRPAKRVRYVKREEEILPGISVFWIGGHSPADQAVSVRTLSGNTVITSDTVFLYRNIEENVPVGYFYNLEECYDAMETIRNVADVILPTHDPEVLVRHPGGV